MTTERFQKRRGVHADARFDEGRTGGGRSGYPSDGEGGISYFGVEAELCSRWRCIQRATILADNAKRIPVSRCYLVFGLFLMAIGRKRGKIFRVTQNESKIGFSFRSDSVDWLIQLIDSADSGEIENYMVRAANQQGRSLRSLKGVPFIEDDRLSTVRDACTAWYSWNDCLTKWREWRFHNK